ncbi:HNH endonuclease [Bacillus cereus group sp. BfR-BA-01423]|uniref:HNH endonuclease n=1 Tax=Bacillus cereus group TaxID=86661 RepID=UPI001F589312|nr:HNH endonuclease [Bacillus cereus group sp. BfR-BA-01423]
MQKRGICVKCRKLVEKINRSGYCNTCDNQELMETRELVRARELAKAKKKLVKVKALAEPKEVVKTEKSVKAKQLVQEIEAKEKILDKIIHIAGEMDIRKMAGFEFIDFSVEKKSTLLKYDKEILRDLLDALEDLYHEHMDMMDEEKGGIINPLEILNKYKDGVGKVNEKESVINDTWRKYIPSVIKKSIPNWRHETVTFIYEKSKELMANFNGAELRVVREFICELSEIIYDNESEEEEEELYQADDDVAAFIMSVVEMIILPHLEVLDRLEKHGGKIIYSNLWNVAFNESLKIEVKDRDGWKCVICECETDLHVHHKIPRKLGGIHHKDNLVTLCASCHKAVETANVKEAFKTCFANYKKSKFRGRKREEISHDKTLLKSEVESSLDELVATLNNKDENELVEELLVVMEKLEIIFYD